ncbi:CsxC family protein [Bacillus sp. JCM 19034]|uniref:CsxC family protein n=1 Tax=Bacillus sp. JCM 19034 TaxID=1481928 RepID=UPI000784469F|nr:hypothetical protein [Bacillus sp. JCM 19034]
MNNNRNEFVRSENGLIPAVVSNRKKKVSGYTNQTCPTANNNQKCPPAKQNQKAKVKQIDAEAIGLGVEGNVLNVPVIDAPVALAEVELAANVEADITLPTYATEIKNIRKNVSLTQCKAVPSLAGPNFVTLFISGIIHKNIQYSDGSGFIRDYAVDVPFSTNQTIALVNPRDRANVSVKNSVTERRELAKNGHGADRCTHGQVNFEYFNEPIKCKLLASFINEVDITNDFDKQGRFRCITEKMEVILFIKLTQNQQVAIGEAENAETESIRTRIQELNEQNEL